MVHDHDTIFGVFTISISEFKATCLALLEKVQRTGQPLLITKRGVPIAQVLPPPPRRATRSKFGCMAGTLKEIGDIVAPVGGDDWESLRP